MITHDARTYLSIVRLTNETHCATSTSSQDVSIRDSMSAAISITLSHKGDPICRQRVCVVLYEVAKCATCLSRSASVIERLALSYSTIVDATNVYSLLTDHA